MAVDPRDFLLNTDYEMDKIVLFKEGSFTQTKDIPHDLGFIPLPFGVWSTDSDFNSTNTISGIDASGDDPGYTPLLSVSLTAKSDKLVLKSGGNTNNATIYYRIYAFEPSSSAQAVPATSSNANTFILNTDYNYAKLLAKGEFTSSGQEYQHNLGYLPQVLAWMQYTSGGEENIEFLSFGSEFTNIKLTVTNSKIKAGTLSSVFVNKIHWRIYYDEA